MKIVSSKNDDSQNESGECAQNKRSKRVRDRVDLVQSRRQFPTKNIKHLCDLIT